MENAISILNVRTWHPLHQKRLDHRLRPQIAHQSPLFSSRALLLPSTTTSAISYGVFSSSSIFPTINIRRFLKCGGICFSFSAEFCSTATSRRSIITDVIINNSSFYVALQTSGSCFDYVAVLFR